MMQAKSDAYSITDDNEEGWDYGCDYECLYKFKNPITIEDLHDDPYFGDWGAYRASFQGRVFRITPEYWEKLTRLASKSNKNPGYEEFLVGIQELKIAKPILLEEELEEALVLDIGRLKRFGYDLEIKERQAVCRGVGGRIDLLCYDRKEKRYVVIELKNVRASHKTVGQISRYIGWVKERIAGRTPVVGLVISRGFDTGFEYSLEGLEATRLISQINLEQLGFN